MKEFSLADVLKLSISERLRVMEAIWDSIAEVPEEVELTAAQRQELDRRLEAYARDPAAGSPWSEVRARIEGRG
jgi:putative addiction module component (TIGR02574 family)